MGAGNGVGGVSGAHLKHHLRVIAREKEKHRLHRLGAAPGLASAASPALRAFSSSHIRGGGGPKSCARDRGSEGGGGWYRPRRAARGAGRAGARPAAGEGPQVARCAGARAQTWWQEGSDSGIYLSPGGAWWSPEGREREGGARAWTRVVAAEAFHLRGCSAGAKTRPRPLPRFWGWVLSNAGEGWRKT